MDISGTGQILQHKVVVSYPAKTVYWKLLFLNENNSFEVFNRYLCVNFFLCKVQTFIISNEGFSSKYAYFFMYTYTLVFSIEFHDPTYITSSLVLFFINSQHTWNLYCQTLGLVLRLRVDFVLPLSQQQQQQEEEEEEEPLTKIFQWGVY